MPSAAGIADSMTEPIASAINPATVMCCAPKRSVIMTSRLRLIAL